MRAKNHKQYAILAFLASTVTVQAQEGAAELKKTAVALFETQMRQRCLPLSQTASVLRLDLADLPKVHRIAMRKADGSKVANRPLRTVLEFPCSFGAYNVTYVYMLATDYGLGFAQLVQPQVTTRYASAENDDVVAGIVVNGFSARSEVVNPSLDSASGTLTEYSKWRGLGDAWSTTSWVLGEDGFVLRSYAIDASYDGKTEPQLVWKAP